MAIAALVAITIPAASGTAILSVWGIASLLTLAAAKFATPQQLSRSGRLLTGGAMILLALVHMITRPGTDPMAIIVNGTVIAGGALLVATVVRRRFLKPQVV